MNITYGVVTEESSQNGDYADTGFASQDEEVTLQGLIERIQEYGPVEPSCSPINKWSDCPPNMWWGTTDNGQAYWQDYQDAVDGDICGVRFGFHVRRTKEWDSFLSQRVLYRIHTLLSHPCKEE